jgi:hypothetical protein
MAVMVVGCEKLPRPDGHPLIDGGMDTTSQRGKEDSLEEYYERMERWEMLHGGMSRWESDK